ncbi:MAG: TRAM domain-containing protein, partial [Longicatena sp.]
MKLTIKKTGINGEGIGYLDRTPVFIPGALMDEEVDVRIIERQSRYATAEVNYIVKKSKDRIEPKCKIQHACGGCPLMIAKYPAQLQYKREILKQSLIKYAQVDPRRIGKVLASEQVFEYRNQFKMPCALNDYGEISSGLYMPNSNYFIEIKKCWVHESGLERTRRDVMDILMEYGIEPYEFHEKKGIRSVVIRGFDGKYQCTLVTGNDDIDTRAIDQIMRIKGMCS